MADLGKNAVQLGVFAGLVLLGGYSISTGNHFAEVGTLLLGLGGLFLEKMQLN